MGISGRNLSVTISYNEFSDQFSIRFRNEDDMHTWNNVPGIDMPGVLQNVDHWIRSHMEILASRGSVAER